MCIKSKAIRIVHHLRDRLAITDRNYLCVVGSPNCFADLATDDVQFAVEITDALILGSFTVRMAGYFWWHQIYIEDFCAARTSFDENIVSALGLKTAIADSQSLKQTQKKRIRLMDDSASWIYQQLYGTQIEIPGKICERNPLLQEFVASFNRTVMETLCRAPLLSENSIHSLISKNR